MSLKVLVADKFPDKYIKQMEDLGLQVIYSPSLGENDIPAAALEVDVIVVRSTKVNEKTINDSKQLSLVIRAGAGVNNINIAAANKKGIYVANCPGTNSIAVAELAIGLMISLDRRIPSNVMDFHNGIWNKAEYSKANGLFGKNLGIIGVGNIGREVAKRANAFGMSVYGKDITRVEGYGIKDFSEMDKILPILDVISIHLPLSDQTRHLFNAEMFKFVKPGCLLINTSRAELIDEDAMLDAIKTKGIRVALDVFQGEPEGKGGAVSSKLIGNPNVYITHHIGASTEQAQDAVAAETVRIIKDYLKSGVIAHWVNQAKFVEPHYQLVVKHFDKPGVMASILSVIKKDDINIEEIENLIFDGGHVACCTMKLKKALNDGILEAIRQNPEVLSLSHVSLN